LALQSVGNLESVHVPEDGPKENAVPVGRHRYHRVGGSALTRENVSGETGGASEHGYGSR